ncbi:MAG TPA: 16S rRNA (guanine(527)-N(7))-methyltransferase RsmG [Verrucomicrobiae bacterium]|nr:16S rRNA (guanine(527)-N(7))-methyltransferase RsmG [Verrucomicrobiae bacterium]
MDFAEIARLLEPFAVLSSAQLQQVSLHLDLLLKWNAKINLTAVRRPEEIVTRHFGESFFAARTLLDSEATKLVVDVGSGAGFPGIPLAVFAPATPTVLIESHGKKGVFLNQVIVGLGLRNASVFRGRAESYKSESADLVTMRAVEKSDSSLGLAISLVKPGGRVGLMIGQAQINDVKKLATGVDWGTPVPIPEGHSRVLLAGTKLARTNTVKVD